MNTHNAHDCGHCRAPITAEQRWVREKIYDPAAQDGCEPSYRRYHAEVFVGEQLSCWEKHQLQREMDRTMPRAA